MRRRYSSVVSDSDSPLDGFEPETPRHGRNRRRMSTGAKVLIGALTILLVLGGAAFGTFWWMQRSLSENVESLGDPFEELTDRPTSASELGDDADTSDSDLPMNILVLGSDSRISAGDPSQWEAGAQRTDTIMLVHIPADQENVFVMSIPRDSWVDIPGYGQGKINAAFSYGGPSLMIETVENLTGVYIDHFVVTDFESFEAITDAIGGVEITLTEDFTYEGETIEAGQHRLMTGEQALRWVRERKTLARGDFDRVQRQQAWMRAMVARVRNEGILNNPIETQQLMEAITSSISADDGLTSDVMTQLLGLGRNLGSNDIVFFTAPFTGTGTSEDGQSIVVLNYAVLDGLMAAWNADTLSTYIPEHEADLDMLPAVVD